jgi:hypothetical protein
MSVLNFDSPRGPRSGKSLKLALGAGAVAAIVALASTLAAGININSGPVEFGQGVSETTACDDSLTITPRASFDNSYGPDGDFLFSGFAISDLDSTVGGCAGKAFTIKAYGETSSAVLAAYTFMNNGTSFTSDYGMTEWDNEGTENSSMQLWLANPSVLASSVYKITVESQNAIYASLNFSCDSVPTDAPSYYPCGPQLNVPLSTLTAAGWEPCFEDNYVNESATVDFAIESCDEPYLAVFGQAVAGSSALLLAVAPRNDVFTITSGGTPRLVNGTYWYYTPVFDRGAQSFGFSPTSLIEQTTCDYRQSEGDPSSPYRLCWHIIDNGGNPPLFGEGYRIGIDDEFLIPTYDVGSGNYLRVIYQHTGRSI